MTDRRGWTVTCVFVTDAPTDRSREDMERAVRKRLQDAGMKSLEHVLAIPHTKEPEQENPQ